MWTEESTPPSRVGGMEYYHKIQCESEFRKRSESNLIENEVQRRIYRHRMDNLRQLENRRKRLTDLVQCERKADIARCRQTLVEDRNKSLIKLLKKAEDMKEEARRHNEAVAEQKYMQRRLQNSCSAREAMERFHRNELVKDQPQVIRLRELKEREDLEADAWISRQTSHFQEQLDREELEAQKHSVAKKHFADENLALAVEKISSRAEEKRCQLKEEQLRLIKIIEEDIANDYQNQKLRQNEHRKSLEEDMITLRNRKEEQARVDGLVDKLYQLPLPSASPAQDNRVKEALRQEFLPFLNYKKKVQKDEECFEKDVDKRYQVIADELYAARRNSNCQAYARAKEQAKLIMEEQKEMESKRKEARVKEREAYITSTQELAKQREEIERKISEETLTQRNAAKEYQKTLQQQIIYNQEKRMKYEVCEKEREARSMCRAEEYENKLENLVECDISNFQLHPWRKHSMGID